MTKETFEKIREKIEKSLQTKVRGGDAMLYKSGKAKFSIYGGQDGYGFGIKEAKEAESRLMPLALEIETEFGVKAGVKRLRYQGFINIVNIIAE